MTMTSRRTILPKISLRRLIPIPGSTPRNTIGIILGITIALVPGLTTAGCSDSGVGPGYGWSFIGNNSFEYRGMPSLRGWKDLSPDTSYVGFSKDAPPDGGSWSLRLEDAWTFPGAVVAVIVPLPGDHRYQLSAWGKAVRNSGMNAGGSMILMTRTAGVDTFRQAFHFSDTVWTFASLTERLSSDSVDTIFVRLQGNLDQWSYGDILFDLCNLDIVDVVPFRE